MKKLPLLLLILIATSALISCGRKDDNAEPSVRIIGNWNGARMIELEYQNDDLIDADTTFLAPPNYFTLELKKDNTMKMDYSVHGTSNHKRGVYQINNHSLLIRRNQYDLEFDTYFFKLDGKSLELTHINTFTQNNQTIKEEEHVFFTKQ